MSTKIVFRITLIMVVLNYCLDHLVWQFSSVDSSTSLLSSKYGAFIGNVNSRIFILGGYHEPTDLIEYDIETASYTKHNNSIYFGYQMAQSSIQNDDILYMLPFGKYNISVFNLTSLTMVGTIDGKGHIDRPEDRCLVHYKDHLMVIGGYTEVWVTCHGVVRLIMVVHCNKVV
eukprot:107065_1